MIVITNDEEIRFYTNLSQRVEMSECGKLGIKFKIEDVNICHKNCQ